MNITYLKNKKKSNIYIKLKYVKLNQIYYTPQDTVLSTILTRLIVSTSSI